MVDTVIVIRGFEKKEDAKEEERMNIMETRIVLEEGQRRVLRKKAGKGEEEGIVIVNSRFLQRPQKRNRRNQLIYRRLSKTKSLDSGRVRSRESGRLWWMVFGVKTGRAVGRKEDMEKADERR